MKLSFISLCIFFLFIKNVYPQKQYFKNQNLLQLIPEPNQVVDLKKDFLIKSPKFKTNLQGFGKEFQFFTDYLFKQYNFKIQYSNNATTVFTIHIDTALQSDKKEAYTLYITIDSITIVGKDTVGVFRGLQTLIQLFPFEKKTFTQFSLPCVYIVDEPQFNYRGNHLDVARHFFPASYIKKYIDFLAWYKFNYFHWHLTDNQGWRAEIKAFPKLQNIAAYRYDSLMGNGGVYNTYGRPYGGYYTQQEMKELVKYAQERHITIIPEIEMPAHSLAALAAYPALSCLQQPIVINGKPISDVFCAGNDSTFLFLQQVLDEICTIFPSPYIHIGGDECDKLAWKKCDKCQAVIIQKHLKNENELQSYFMSRISRYLEKKGKKAIVWDEVFENNIDTNLIIMSWTGEENGIQAAQKGNLVIMDPGEYCYLNSSQTAFEDSLVAGGFLPIEKVYSYNPIAHISTIKTQKNIIGTQCNLWTEFIENTKKLEYMLFPRIAAFAEVAWTKNEHKNWNNFLEKLMPEMYRYQQNNMAYSKALWDIKMNFIKEHDTLFLTTHTALKNATYKITINQQFPFYIQHQNLKLPITSFGKYNISLYNPSKQLVNQTDLNFMPNLAFGKSIFEITKPAPQYQGLGIYSLVNGLIAQKPNLSDKEFLGYKNDAIFYIDLGKIQPIKKIQAHFLSETNSWVHPPSNFYVEISNDGNIFNFTPLQIMADKKENFSNGGWWSLETNASARYLKITIENVKKIPEGENGSGYSAWLFIDELMVN